MTRSRDVANIDGILTAKGDIYAATAAATPARLGVGGDGQVLKANSATATGLEWAADAAGMTNPMTTTGDTIYSSSGSTPARLGIGSTGQVMTVAGGVPSWATPAGGGGMTLLSTTTLSGSTTTISGISGSYKDLAILVQGVTTSAAAWIRYLPNGGNPQNMYSVFDGTAGFTEYGTGFLNGASSITFQGTGGTNAWTVTQKDYSGTSFYKPFQFYGAFVNGGHREVTGAGYATTSAAITEISFSTNSSFTGGTIRIYGVS